MTDHIDKPDDVIIGGGYSTDILDGLIRNQPTPPKLDGKPIHEEIVFKPFRPSYLNPERKQKLLEDLEREPAKRDEEFWGKYLNFHLQKQDLHKGLKVVLMRAIEGDTGPSRHIEILEMQTHRAIYTFRDDQNVGRVGHFYFSDYDVVSRDKGAERTVHFVMSESQYNKQFGKGEE